MALKNMIVALVQVCPVMIAIPEGKLGKYEGPECTSSRLSSIIGDKHEKQAFISNYTQLVCKQTRAISNGSISG